MTTTTTWPTTADGKWLVLRTVGKDWRSRDGFQWRKTVETVAPDWDPNPDRDCGGGLHGLLWGCGEAALLSSASDAILLVVAVDPTDVANPDQPNKVRFRAGRVVHFGTRDEATSYLIDHGGYGLPVVWASVTGGDRATVTGGNRATVTGGNGATVTGGDRATVTGGVEATVTGGNGATVTGGYEATVTGGNEATVTGGDMAAVTGGDWATVTGGNRATVTGGNWATVTGGDMATVTGGNRATVTGGDWATVTGGDWATVTGGYRATVTGGNGAILQLRWWDGGRWRIATAYVGEDGIKANTPYRVNERGEFYEVKS